MKLGPFSIADTNLHVLIQAQMLEHLDRIRVISKVFGAEASNKFFDIFVQAINEEAELDAA